MNMKHKNYEWVVAFAEGKSVERKHFGFEGDIQGWQPVKGLRDLDDYACEFRLKPEEPQKSVGYRRYLYNSEGKVFPAVLYENDSYKPHNKSDFRRYVDDTWQYEPVEAPVVNKVEQGEPVPVLVGEVPWRGRNDTRYGVWFMGSQHPYADAGWCLDKYGKEATFKTKKEAQDAIDEVYEYGIPESRPQYEVREYKRANPL